MNPALTKMEGRDPEGGSQRCHLLVTCLFIHSTLCSWATPYQPGGEVEGEHVAPPRSHGLGEAGTETDHDSRGRGYHGAGTGTQRSLGDGISGRASWRR